MLPDQSRCLDTIRRSNTELQVTWRLQFFEVAASAPATPSSAQGCVVGVSASAHTTFGVPPVTVTATVTARGAVVGSADIVWSWPSSTNASTDAPPLPTNAFGEAERLEPWTWQAAWQRVADCFTTSSTDASTQSRVAAAPTSPQADQGGALTQTWRFLVDLPGAIWSATTTAASTVVSTVQGIGRWLLWSVKTTACTMYQYLVPNPQEISRMLLRGPSTDCRTVSAGTIDQEIGGAGADRRSMLVCEDVGLFTWWLTSLNVAATRTDANPEEGCAGPNIKFGTMLKPLTEISADGQTPFQFQEFKDSNDFSELDGRYLSTCDTTPLGKAVTPLKPYTSAMLYIISAAIYLGLLRALPKVISGGEVQ